MKTINVAITDMAHKNLKTMTDEIGKNQSDIVSFILEDVNVEQIVRKMRNNNDK